ncbi:hypothetical protein UFOVP964_141 [uncultured Caudovirales phage]|uniref:Uncharacterized protein n=1 Tax=uncultured Caudovirales phage TaxID=2100421 RepID=A0A6J7XQ62_9CAUD|nr:hypothetical protein UFOVP854_141 [uncultured Caudovirales phage]CAB4175261.1 hypothetical protein UFOVP964_141 [uncultured Caudovirales phage]CAB4178936.1 hypothetical protein UFOVP1034_17 [uncultured Caudovirales phage]CAB4189061.1 hypothetical protein UFOVP1177_17 [uncultured Caudovirales phage]CAB4192993.1 hypothetical protein UFOVP1243_4 [uncultured Caudovirales phage]
MYSPRGPFPPEVLEQPRMNHTEDYSDSLHVGLDDVRFFKCRDCGEVLLETGLDDHICEEPDNL